LQLLRVMNLAFLKHVLFSDEFENIKWVIRIRKSKKDG